jgi:starch synthase
MKNGMLSSEIAPYAKYGGLADVVGTLSVALERQGHELCLVMPAYRSVLQGTFPVEDTITKFSVPVSTRQEEALILRARLGNNVAVYFVRADRYFDRESLYGTAQGDYSDNAERFVFFSRAALEVLRRRPVDMVHCHDWQTALGIVFLKTQSDRYPELSAANTVFTIHNLGFHGIFSAPEWHLLDLDRSFFTPQYLEFYGSINFVKGALLFADRITTVSPSYAREIMETEQGFGLEGVLAQRAKDIVGILNGVDYEEWNPETDRWIPKHYSKDTLTEKRSCKKRLQATLRLPPKPNVPLVGMISRMTAQKGFDLVEKAFDRLMERQLQLVLLGSGEPRYEDFFTTAAAKFPDKFSARIGFDEPLAHQIEAGADIFLMPSLYEPCGLNQMFSLKYGTIPIVRAVGGLKDTVEDYDREKSTGTGFVFRSYDPESLLEAVDRALDLFQDKRAWMALRRRAMSMDFSWDRSARAYGSLYQQLLHRRVDG